MHRPQRAPDPRPASGADRSFRTTSYFVNGVHNWLKPAATSSEHSEPQPGPAGARREAADADTYEAPLNLHFATDAPVNLNVNNELLPDGSRTRNRLHKIIHLNVPQVPMMRGSDEISAYGIDIRGARDFHGSAGRTTEDNRESFNERELNLLQNYKYFDTRPVKASDDATRDTRSSFLNYYHEEVPSRTNTTPNIRAVGLNDRDSQNAVSENALVHKPQEHFMEETPITTNKKTQYYPECYHNFDLNIIQSNNNIVSNGVSVKLEPGSEDISQPSSDLQNDPLKDNEEEASWTDVDFLNPFQKDMNAVAYNRTDNSTLVGQDDSCLVAEKTIEDDPTAYDRSKVYCCPHCGVHFNHPKRFLVHFKWHTYGQTNEKRRLIEETKMMRRLERRKAPTKPYTEGTFACELCDMTFDQRQRYRTHKTKAHPALPKECPICLQMFPNQQEMKDHTRDAHTQESGDPFHCAECPKTFKFMHSLVRHQATHMEKKFPCEKCEKRFGSELLLNIHNKCHERAEKGHAYHCSYCGKGFHQPYNLGVHERGHSGERPFECHLCKSTYQSNSSLVRHIRVSHQNPNKSHRCTICQKSFLTDKIRERHALRVHDEPAASLLEGTPSEGRRRRRRRGRRRGEADADGATLVPCGSPSSIDVLYAVDGGRLNA